MEITKDYFIIGTEDMLEHFTPTGLASATVDDIAKQRFEGYIQAREEFTSQPWKRTQYGIVHKNFVVDIAPLGSVDLTDEYRWNDGIVEYHGYSAYPIIPAMFAGEMTTTSVTTSYEINPEFAAYLVAKATQAVTDEITRALNAPTTTAAMAKRTADNKADWMAKRRKAHGLPPL